MQVAAQRLPEAVGVQHLLEPFDAGPEELVVAEGVLHRIVDHRHQRDDRREGHQQQHRQHHEPGLVVPGLVHRSGPHLDAPGIGVDVDAAGSKATRGSAGSGLVLAEDAASSRPSRLARTTLWRPMSSTLLDRDRHALAAEPDDIPAGCRARSAPALPVGAPGSAIVWPPSARSLPSISTGSTFMPGEPMK